MASLYSRYSSVEAMPAIMGICARSPVGRFGGALIAVALVVALPAQGAPWEPKAKPARELMKQGRAAFADGRYADAAALFLQSADTESTNNARWNAGQAMAAAGDWRGALDLFDTLAKDKTVPKERRNAVQERRRVAAVFVAADYAAEAHRWDDAAAVLQKLIDDPALGDRDRASATAALGAVAPKRAAVEAEAARARDEAAARDAASTREPSSPLVTNQPTEQRPREPSRVAVPSRMSDTVALGLLGAGIVGVGIGAGLVWNASQLDDDASAEGDQSRRLELSDRADGRRTAGKIALGLGGALVIGGAIKLAIPPDAPRATVATIRRVNGGAMVVLGGSF